MRMIFLKRLAVILLGVASLSACSIFSPVKPECINEYMVDTVPHIYDTRGSTIKTIAVTMPTGNRIYATKEMAYSTHTHTIEYFAKNRWAEVPAQMLQPLIIQTLQNTRYFKAVAPSGGTGRFDLQLNTQLLKFHQEFFDQQSVFKLTLRAQIINVTTGRVIASKEFVVVESAPSRNPYGGVVAANRATAKVLRELAMWTVKYY